MTVAIDTILSVTDWLMTERGYDREAAIDLALDTVGQKSNDELRRNVVEALEQEQA